MSERVAAIAGASEKLKGWWRSPFRIVYGNSAPKHVDTGADAGGWPALITAGLSVALILIDGFIISAAAPEITAAFSIGADRMGWLIAAYTLPLAVAPVVFGMMGDRFGLKRLFFLGMSLLIAASLLCALSRDLTELTACRFLQGMGAAMLSPQTLAAAAAAFGPEKRGFAIGVWGAISSLGLLLGPLLGGAMLAYLPWHSIFLMNLPLGLLAMLAFAIAIPGSGKAVSSSWRLPLASIGLLVSGAAVLVLSFGSLARGEAIGGVGTALGGVLLFFWFQRERSLRGEASALVGRDLLGNRLFAKAAAAAFAMNASTAGTVAVLSLIIVRMHTGVAPSVMTGLLFVPAMIAVIIFMPLAGKLAQSQSAVSRRLLTASAAAAIVSPLLIGVSLGALGSVSLVLCAASIAIQGIAGAMLLSFATFSALVAAGPRRAGLASGAISMARNLGSALGAAALTAAAATFAGQGWAFLISALFALLALPFCLNILSRIGAS